MDQFGQITHTHTYAVPFHTRKFFTTLRVNSPSFSRRIVPLFPSILVNMGEGSGTLTKPHHTPSPEAQQTSPTATSSPSLPPSLALPTIADEPASPIRDDSQGEAYPTVSGLEAEQDRANITKTSTLPSDSTPRVTSLAPDEGKIATLKARIKHLEDRDGGDDDPSGEDATIKGRRLETGEEAEVATESVHPATISVPIGSDVVPTACPIFTTATVATPYSRRKGKENMVESDTPKKKKLQEQIAIQEYEQFTAELTIGEKIELINELVKYQDHHKRILKYQAQQSKPLSKKQQREFYILVLKSQAEEGERFKRKGLRLEQESAKKVKTLEEVSEEDLKTMMQLVLVEELWALVKETLSIRPTTSDKEKGVWVKLKRLYEPDVEDQLWTQTQALMMLQ
nr:hypothetical protein [Tanacetum cinerariifolium]